MEEVDQETINSLLNPLGYRVKFTFGYWRVYDNKFGLGSYGYMPNDAKWQYLAELNLVDLLSQIGKTKLFDITSNGNSTKNPYFGCNSLEEMLIKRDLIA